ncbi:hypothetical protein INR49_016277 [Caranx melampygus]|nr:hypothetical protein INR49_016277 [Caranx melampygus]
MMTQASTDGGRTLRADGQERGKGKKSDARKEFLSQATDCPLKSLVSNSEKTCRRPDALPPSKAFLVGWKAVTDNTVLRFSSSMKEVRTLFPVQGEK